MVIIVTKEHVIPKEIAEAARESLNPEVERKREEGAFVTIPKYKYKSNALKWYFEGINFNRNKTR
jgi:hypothetical protein